MYLQANNVEKFYGNKEARVQVLKGISCGIEQGEICVLLYSPALVNPLFKSDWRH